MDPAYGREPVGAPGCDVCDAWHAEREAARKTRERERVQRANAEITRHPDHSAGPGEEAFA
ncbi:hypothetical protein [Streptomyces sp. ERV7]|uniref:hypothetical protein n=1 Tax=Streptomyces sp. ERV7 TaxID=1322334 RepID=UPI00131CF5B1|nr:hypothetical protein [Streptomyces sp. ERV7]